MKKQKVGSICMLLLHVSWNYAMYMSGEQAKRIAPRLVARGQLEQVEEPANFNTFNGYWFKAELLEHPAIQRLEQLDQVVKDAALGVVGDLSTRGKKYLAACAMAAGANHEQTCGKLVSWLSEAIERDDINFVATMAPFKPNPNRREMCYKESFAQVPLFATPRVFTAERIAHHMEIPLFFKVQSPQMALWLWTLNADYTQRGGIDDGTVLHHLCSFPPERHSDAAALCAFYLKKGADPHAVDAVGRLPLHCIARRVNNLNIEQLLPCMLLMLRAGADTGRKDNHGMSFEDYMQRSLYNSISSRIQINVLNAYQESRDKNKCGRAEYYTSYESDLLKAEEPACYCECLETEQTSESKDLDFLRSCIVKAAEKPLEKRVNFNCRELQQHPALSHWRPLLLSGKNLEELLPDMRVEIWQAVVASLLDYNVGRTLAAFFAIILRDDAFLALGDANIVMEDDYDVTSFMFQHVKPKPDEFCTCLSARTLPMAKLLKRYGYYTQFVDAQENTPFHYFARHGKLVEPGLIDFYVKENVDPCAKNSEDQTAADLLVEYSYRFDGHEEKLAAFLTMLKLHGAVSKRAHEKTGKTLLEAAQEAHSVWELPCTALVVTMLQELDGEKEQITKL
ncbi:MAG: hypothetical protein AB7F19_06765 [Candidatus Babeliales bacterium]